MKIIYKKIYCTLLILMLSNNIFAEEKNISLKGIVKPDQIIGLLGKKLGTTLTAKGVIIKKFKQSKEHSKELTSLEFHVTHVDNVIVDDVTLIISHNSMRKLDHLENSTKIELKGYETFYIYGRPSGKNPQMLQIRPEDLVYRIENSFIVDELL